MIDHIKNIYLVPANQQEQVRVLPLPGKDTKSDVFHCLDAEIRDSLQKLALTGYKKAKMHNRALQQALAYVMEEDQEKGDKGSFY